MLILIGVVPTAFALNKTPDVNYLAAYKSAAANVEVRNEVVLNQVLVRFLATDGDHDARTRRVIERVQHDGTCWMSGTTWRGQAAMRISVSNWSTDEADVDRSVAAILRCAAE